jgi:hypothetical protein
MHPVFPNDTDQHKQGIERARGNHHHLQSGQQYHRYQFPGCFALGIRTIQLKRRHMLNKILKFLMSITQVILLITAFVSLITAYVVFAPDELPKPFRLVYDYGADVNYTCHSGC